jgi:hypothetical protein
MKKLILFLFLIIIANSCKRTKSIIIEKEKIRIDTVINKIIITKFNAVHDTLTIDNPCDSAGILTTFYSKIILPQGKIIIRSYKGNIQATVNIDSIRNVYENKYRYKETSNVTNSKKIVTTNIIPAWCILTIIILSFIILGYLYFKIFYV